MEFHWTKLDAKGTAPSPRYGHSMCFVGNAAYIFGGAAAQGDSDVYFNDMYKLDMSTQPPTWSAVAQKGAIPSKREGHSMNLVGKTIYVFGGVGDGGCLNDLYAFEVDSNTWKAITSASNAPSKRNNHSAAVYKTQLYICGGFLDGVAGNDVHMFDTKTQKWMQVNVSGKPLEKRCDHTWTLLGGKYLVLFGGANDSTWFNDTMSFNVENNSWAAIETKGSAPNPRDYHTAVSWDNTRMVVFGGANEAETPVHYNDVCLFSLDSGLWSKPKVEGNCPRVRWAHSGEFFKDGMYVFGGTTTDTSYNDLWVLKAGPAPAAAAAPSTTDAPPSRPPRGKQVLPTLPTRTAAVNAASPGPSTPPASTTPAAAPAATAAAAPAAVAMSPQAQKLQDAANEKTATPIPTKRRTVAPSTPESVPQRDFSDARHKAKDAIDKLYDELEQLARKTDSEVASLNAQRSDFEKEKQLNMELFEKQQKELADLAAKRQHEVDMRIKELNSRQKSLDDREKALDARQAKLDAENQQCQRLQVDLEEKRKKIDQVMAQFSNIK